MFGYAFPWEKIRWFGAFGASIYDSMIIYYDAGPQSSLTSVRLNWTVSLSLRVTMKLFMKTYMHWLKSPLLRIITKRRISE